MSLTWRNKPISTDSTLFSCKRTSFTSCCAYQHIVGTAVQPNLLELQSSNICALKVDVSHHCQILQWVCLKFLLLPIKCDSKRILEIRDLYYKIKFQILLHFPWSPVQNTFIAQGNILPSTLCGAVLTPSLEHIQLMGRSTHTHAHTELVRKVQKVGQNYKRTPLTVAPNSCSVRGKFSKNGSKQQLLLYTINSPWQSFRTN